MALPPRWGTRLSAKRPRAAAPSAPLSPPGRSFPPRDPAPAAGPGIDEGQYARLFERFYSQGHANGAGLGLAIVQMIVSKIGSTLQLYNLPQGGLCAELRINEGAPLPKG